MVRRRTDTIREALEQEQLQYERSRERLRLDEQLEVELPRDQKRAEELFHRASEMPPSHLNEAVEMLKEAYRLSPDDPEIRAGLIETAVQYGNELFDGTIYDTILEPLLPLKKEGLVDALVYDLLGKAYLYLGYANESIQELQEAVRLYPGSPDIHFFLALAYLLKSLEEFHLNSNVEVAQSYQREAAQETATGWSLAQRAHESNSSSSNEDFRRRTRHASRVVALLKKSGILNARGIKWFSSADIRKASLLAPADYNQITSSHQWSHGELAGELNQFRDSLYRAATAGGRTQLQEIERYMLPEPKGQSTEESA